jgi:threonine aldolase
MHDLRSDTVTQPSAAMRAAMADAEVGDDVFGEDPTVNRLEARAAELFGKPAALFVPSGTMGNQICMAVLAPTGSEIIADAQAHVLLNEAGAVARLWGCQICPVEGELGVLAVSAVEAMLRDEDVHHPVSSVVSVENTHNYAGGTVWPQESLDAIAVLCRERGLALHMDAARIFNAQVATGVPVATITRDVDMATFCLSKGLGAPVGSLVVGSSAHMAQARRVRKLLGGAMRQAGVLAAAALIALDEGPALLRDDHRRAAELARALAELPGLEVDPEAVHTNIVFATTRGTALEAETKLAERGVLTLALAPRRLRFVFHRDVGDDALDAAIEAATALFG